jgi:hypothetical protein
MRQLLGEERTGTAQHRHLVPKQFRTHANRLKYRKEKNPVKYKYSYPSTSAILCWILNQKNHLSLLALTRPPTWKQPLTQNTDKGYGPQLLIH